eukprot:gene25105-5451_t
MPVDALPLTAGIRASGEISGETKCPVWVDFNGDGWPDVLIPGAPSVLLRNDPAPLFGGRVRNDPAPLFGGRVFNAQPLFPAAAGCGTRSWPPAGAARPPPTPPAPSSAPAAPASGAAGLLRGLRRNLVFAACAADFDQDGVDDVYLGYWNYHDVVLLGTGAGFRVGWVVDKATSKVADPRTSSFPGIHPGGWRGLRRCGSGPLRAHGDSRTHGVAFGDLDRDGAQDAVFNLGGFAMADAELLPKLLTVQQHPTLVPPGETITFAEGLRKVAAQNHCTGKWEADGVGASGCMDAVEWCVMCPGAADCDTREACFVYALAPGGARLSAWVRLRSGRGGGAALGARITVTGAGGWRRHTAVRSAQAFQSQGSAWALVAVGPSGRAEVT